MEEIIKRYLEEKENKIVQLEGEVKALKEERLDLDKFKQLHEFVVNYIIENRNNYLDNLKFIVSSDMTIDTNEYYYRNLSDILKDFGITSLDFIYSLILEAKQIVIKKDSNNGE